MNKQDKDIFWVIIGVIGSLVVLVTLYAFALSHSNAIRVINLW